MSNINFIALGGIEEKGKNLYLVEVEKDIFILDSGFKYANSDMVGVDMILPNIEYLIQNKDRVKGIFLSTSFLEHFGGVLQVLEHIDTKIYASQFTLDVLRDFVLISTNLNLIESKLVTVKSGDVVWFGQTKVFFFQLPYTIPGTLGFSLSTPDGNIVYTGCYNFDQNTKIDYQDVYLNLAKIGLEKVLLLLTQAVCSDDHFHRGTIFELKRRLESYFFKTKERIIISCYSYDLDRIQKIIDIAVKNKRKVVFATRKNQYTLTNALKSRYITIPHNYKLDINKDNEYIKHNKDVVVLVCGNRKELFNTLEKMATGMDRLITFNKDDLFISLTNPFAYTEMIAAHTFDILSKHINCIVTFKKELLPPPEASREEMKQMLNILKPKYVIPVIGEYVHLYNYNIVASCVGFKKHQIILADLGEIHRFEDSQYIGKSGNIPIGEIMIDGDISSDVHDHVIKDRKLLADSGIIIISLVLNPRTGKLLSDIKFTLKGLTFEPNAEFMESEIKKIILKKIEESSKEKNFKINVFKNALRDLISFFVFKNLKLSPLICPTIIGTT